MAAIALWSIFFLIILPITPLFSLRLLALSPVLYIIDEARLAVRGSRHRRAHLVGACLFASLMFALIYIALREGV